MPSFSGLMVEKAKFQRKKLKVLRVKIQKHELQFKQILNHFTIQPKQN